MESTSKRMTDTDTTVSIQKEMPLEQNVTFNQTVQGLAPIQTILFLYKKTPLLHTCSSPRTSLYFSSMPTQSNCSQIIRLKTEQAGEDGLLHD